MTSSILAFSVDHYFNAEIGDGLFARGDIGWATTRFSSVQLFTQPSTYSTAHGLGLRAGVGYSFLISRDTRLPITLQAQYNFTGSAATALIGIFSFGFLF